MKRRISLVATGALFALPMAHAKPPVEMPTSKGVDAPAGDVTVWVPGAKAPRDAAGNTAVANAPRRGEVQNGGPAGGMRGLASWAPFGPSGANAETISASPTAAGVIIVGLDSTVGGGALYRSTDGGSSWTPAPGTGNGAVKEVEFASNGTAWAATGNGLFTSTDDGQTWSEVFLPIAGQALVEDVAVDATNPSVVWVGLGQFLGGVSTQLVFKSTDGGVSWADASPPVGSGLGATVVAIDPWNSQRVYSAFAGNFGIGAELWVSTDGGTTWAFASGGLPNVMYNDVAFDMAGVAYVVGGQDFGSQFMGLYSTADDGLSWTEMSAGWPSQAARAVALDPANPATILVGTTRAGLVRSTDAGATWTHSAGGTGSYQVNDVEFVPGSSNIVLGMGSVAVFRSTDAGATFAPSSNGMSSLNLTSFAVNPLNSSEIAASYEGSNDGGIFVSTDGGATWTLTQAPLPRWKKVYFAPDGTLYGTHDGPLGRANDGLWVRAANGTWSNLGPGAPTSLDNIGFDVAVTPGPNPKILWGTQAWLGTWAARVWSYNRDGTNAWELEYEGPSEFDQINSVLWLNGGAGPEALASVVNFGSAGAGGIIRSADSGDTWAPSENGYVTGWTAWGLAQGPQDDNTVYVNASVNPGAGTGSIFKSTDGGLNWTQQGSTPASRPFELDPAFPGTIFIHPTWTGAGPERSTDDGASFSPYNDGYLNVGTYDLVYGGTVAGERRLYAATSGGGFATELPPAGNTCPADWNADETVNSSDISAFLTSWLASVTAPDTVADFNGDGVTNSSDISSFLTAWLDAVVNGC